MSSRWIITILLLLAVAINTAEAGVAKSSVTFKVTIVESADVSLKYNENNEPVINMVRGKDDPKDCTPENYDVIGCRAEVVEEYIDGNKYLSINF